jgi:hypothetical protein
MRKEEAAEKDHTALTSQRKHGDQTRIALQY